MCVCGTWFLQHFEVVCGWTVSVPLILFHKTFDKTTMRLMRDAQWEVSTLLTWLLQSHLMLHTHSTLCSVSLSEWVPERREKWTGLISCYFPLPFLFFPSKDSFSIAMVTRVVLYIKYIYLCIDSLGHPPQKTPRHSLSATLIRFARHPCISSSYFCPVVYGHSEGNTP